MYAQLHAPLHQTSANPVHGLDEIVTPASYDAHHPARQAGNDLSPQCWQECRWKGLVCALLIVGVGRRGIRRNARDRARLLYSYMFVPREKIEIGKKPRAPSGRILLQKLRLTFHVEALFSKSLDQSVNVGHLVIIGNLHPVNHPVRIYVFHAFDSPHGRPGPLFSHRSFAGRDIELYYPDRSKGGLTGQQNQYAGHRKKKCTFPNLHDLLLSDKLDGMQYACAMRSTVSSSQGMSRLWPVLRALAFPSTICYSYT